MDSQLRYTLISIRGEFEKANKLFALNQLLQLDAINKDTYIDCMKKVVRGEDDDIFDTI